MSSRRLVSGRLALVASASLVVAVQATAQPPEAAFREANAAALAGDHPRALAGYRALAESGQRSSSLYWNWAQAASALGRRGEALWALRQGLDLDPRDRAIPRQLETLRESLALEPAEIAPEPLEGLGRAGRRWHLSLVAALLAAISVALHGGSRWSRGPAPWGPGRAAVVAFGLALLASLPALSEAAARPTAVVVEKGASLLEAASPEARALGGLREGEVVLLLDQSLDYLRIEDSSGARGWARITDVRPLRSLSGR